MCAYLKIIPLHTIIPGMGPNKNSPGGAYPVQPAVQPAHRVMERACRTFRVICRCMQYLEGRVAGGSGKPFNQKTENFISRNLGYLFLGVHELQKGSSMRAPF